MPIRTKRVAREKRERRGGFLSWWRRLLRPGISDPKVQAPTRESRKLFRKPVRHEENVRRSEVHERGDPEFTFRSVSDIPPVESRGPKPNDFEDFEVVTPLPSSALLPNRPESAIEIRPVLGMGDETGSSDIEGQTGLPKKRRKSSADAYEMVARSPWWALVFAVAGTAVFGWALIGTAERKGMAGQTHELEFWRVDEPAFIAARSRVLAVPWQKSEESPGFWSFPLQRMPELKSRIDVANRIGFQVDLPDFRRGGGNPLGGKWQVQEAELRDSGGKTWFRLAGPLRLRSGDLLELEREVTTLLQSVPDFLEFRIRGSGDGIPTFRCHVAREDSLKFLVANHPGLLAHAIKATDAGGGKTNFCFPLGRYTTPEVVRPVTRLEMVSRLWGYSKPEEFQNLLMLWFCGVGAAWILFPWRLWKDGAASRSRWIVESVRAGGAVGLLVFSLCGIQAMWNPPLQGSDEAAHTLSYFELIGDSGGRAELVKFGNQVHAARVWLRPHQKIAPADLGEPHPYFVNHPDGMQTDPMARSALGSLFWKWTAKLPFLDSRHRLPQRLLRLRWAHGWMFAAGAGMAAALITALRRDRLNPPWVILAVAAIPGASWYGMNISNYPLIMAGALVLGALTVASISKSRGSHWLGVAWGMVAGWVMLCSSSSSPVFVGLLVVLLARPVRAWFGGQHEDLRTLREIAIFWVGLWLGLTLMRLASNPAFDAKSAEAFHGVARRLSVEFLTRLPFAVVSFIVVLAYGLLEGLACALSREKKHPVFRGPENGSNDRRAWIVAGVVMLGWLVATLWPAHPLTALREVVPLVDVLPGTGIPRPILLAEAAVDSQPPTAVFLKEFAGAALRAWGAGEPDYLVSRLFWGASGLLESVLPTAWIRWMTTWFVAGLVFLLMRLISRGQGLRALDLMVALGGIGAYVLAIALGCRLSVGTPPVQGRYLVGAYLWLIPILALGWQPVLNRGLKWRPFLVAAVVVAAVLGLHWIHLSQVMLRYFG